MLPLEWLSSNLRFFDHTDHLEDYIRPAIPGAKIYPGSELILPPPTTPEPILIDEWLIEGLLGEYKSHFPKATVSREE